MAVNSFNAQNPPLTTKGDLFTFSTIPTRIGVGANDTVLTADSAEATGLKWAAPSSGGGMTLLSTTTLSSTTTTISGISGAYKNLQLVIRKATTSNQAKIQIKPNASNQSVYSCKTSGATTWTEGSGNIDPGIGQNNDSTGANFNLVMNFYNYADASNPTPFDFCGFLFDLGGNPVSMNGAGGFRTDAAVSSIEILSTSGNLGGTALLYGVN